jgi:gamma-glutamylcyclotransferase (GGCT)/AIG2-like uncharacterized protein YtfP
MGQRDSLLFVYGTLRPVIGSPVGRWLAGVTKFVGPASIEGRLYDLGRFPGLIAAPGGGRVVGDLLRLRNPAATFDVLDRYEGAVTARRPLFRRVRLHVSTKRGRRRAWMYVYARRAVPGRRIAGGDYSRASACT